MSCALECGRRLVAFPNPSENGQREQPQAGATRSWLWNHLSLPRNPILHPTARLIYQVHYGITMRICNAYVCMSLE